MKRMIILIIPLISLIFLYFPKSILGACNSLYRIQGNCDSSLYNCARERESFNGIQCERCQPNDCCEIISVPVIEQPGGSIITTLCYAPIGISPPSPGECGNIGNLACKDASGNAYCKESNLIPIIETPRGWVCRESSKIPLRGIQPGLCNQGQPNEGIQTALGCIPTKNTTQFVGWLLGSAIKIAGGIAFLLIIFGAIKILTSAGSPENVKAGQEMITSALMGLLFIIFSLFLLELIGVKILNIPDFGK